MRVFKKKKKKLFAQFSSVVNEETPIKCMWKILCDCPKNT